MANDSSSVPGDPLESQSTALLPAAPAEESNGEWNGVSTLAEPVAAAAPDVTIYLHALRRRWLAALGLGLACGASIGVAVWFGMGTKYTAVSYLRVMMVESEVFRRTDPYAVDPIRFDIYKSTQEQLLLSRFVLMAALRKPEVYRIPAIRDAQQNGDPVDWLMRRVSVYFPGRAEVMAVSVTRDDPAEAQTLVKAVVDSYLTEVVNVERDQKRQRVTELDSVCATKEDDLRKKRQEMRVLGLEAGSVETEVLTVKNRLILEELAVARGELARTQTEMGKLRAGLAGEKALLKNADEAEVNAVELEMLVNSDPVARELGMELGYKKMDENYQLGAAKEGTKTPYITRYHDQVKMLQDQYDAQVEKLRQKVREKQRTMIGEQIIQLETQLKRHGRRAGGGGKGNQ